VRTQPRKSGPKGGRPQGSGNRIQMTPKGNNFGCRSARFTGVYRAQRVTLRWRTQFSYARKVRLALLLLECHTSWGCDAGMLCCFAEWCCVLTKEP
jgi:hypothetical protein